MAADTFTALLVFALVSSITPDGFEPTRLAYVICASMGVMTSLFGAFLGEKMQMTRGPRTATK